GRGDVVLDAAGGDLDADRDAGVHGPDPVEGRPEVADTVDVAEPRRRVAGLADGDAADRGDLLGDLGAGQQATEAGLGTLADLDLDRVGDGDRLLGPAEVPGRHLEDVAAGGPPPRRVA